MTQVNVKQRKNAEEVAVEVIADSIVAIAEGIRRLRNTRLTDRALFLLIQDAAPSIGGKYKTSPVTLKEIKAVFEGIESLERTFLKKKA